MRFPDNAVRAPKLTCWYQQGKVCYDKRGAISAANLRYKKDHVKLRPYWCNKCNFFHLTKRLTDIWNDEEKYRSQNKLTHKFMNQDENNEESVETPEVTVTDLPSEGQGTAQAPASTPA